MYTSAGLSSLTPPIMNLIISNVPGPPFPIYTSGARVEALYTMGPLLYGTGINITVFSYAGNIDFGFMVCRDLVDDHWSLAEGIPLAHAELLAAARQRSQAEPEPQVEVEVEVEAGLAAQGDDDSSES
jgi:hypothetical protein